MQNIKLAEVYTGIGKEYVRKPRLPLYVEERKYVIQTIEEGVKTRLTLPDYKNL